MHLGPISVIYTQVQGPQGMLSSFRHRKHVCPPRLIFMSIQPGLGKSKPITRPCLGT